MSTYRELVYLLLDEVKGSSDDFDFTEDHLIYILDKNRAYLLKQKYNDVKKVVHNSNYQTIKLNLSPVEKYTMVEDKNSHYLNSIQQIPQQILIGIPRVYSEDYYFGEITYINRDRMRYVGNNKWLEKFIYCTSGADGFLNLKSLNPKMDLLETVLFTGVFEHAAIASELVPNRAKDVLDRVFPMEENMIPYLIEMSYKELAKSFSVTEDIQNNAHNDVRPVGKTQNRQ